MKPLTSTKVKRGEELKEWEPAADQATDAGRNAFWKRQQERMKAAQAKPQTHVVIEIKRKP